MRILKAIELHNVVCYDHLRFDLDKNGLSIIYGRNKDSGEDEKKSNGAGKTLPFTMMCETLMDRTPLLDGKHVVRDGFFRKGAKSIVEWDDYRVEKFVTGKTPKLDLLRQVGDNVWKPTKVRTLDYVKGKMETLMPVSADEFFALYFIDSNRPTILQRGTHAQRLALFSKLFNLDKYDLIQGEVKERLKVMRKEDQRLSAILDQLALLEPQVPDDLDEKVADLRAKQKKQTTLNQRRSEASRLLNMATSYQANARSLTELRAFWKKLGKKMGKEFPPEPDWLDPEFLTEFISAAKEGHRNLKKALSKAYEQQAATHKIEDARSRVAKLEAKVGDWDITSLKQQLKLAQAYEDDLDEYRREHKRLTKEMSALVEVDEPAYGKDLTRARLKAAYPDVKLVDLLDHAQGKRSEAKAISEMADRSFNKFEEKFATVKTGCECPTCHADLDAATIKEIRKNLNDVVAAKDALFKQADDDLKLAKHYIDWMNFVRGSVTIGSALAELEKPEEYTGPDADQLADIKSAISQLATAQADLAELEELVVGELPDLEELSERGMYYKSAVSNAESVFASHRVLAQAVEAGADEYDMDELREGLDKVDRVIERLMKDVPALTQQVSVAQKVQSQIKQLHVEKVKLETAMADMPILKAFDDAYGQKGLKNLAIQRVCQTIESNMNVNASLLFDEPIRFSIEVTETQVNILAHRSWAKEDSEVDIRRLSGAESRAINLLLPISILPLIPSERRLNVMILDEPTANMDDPAVDMVVNKFLPKLRQLVPHVIVLSPLQLPLDVDDAEVWTVTRENGRSILAKAA